MMSVYTPIRHTDPSRSMEEEFAKGLMCSSKLGMIKRHCKCPLLSSSTPNSSSASVCASSVAYAAPMRPRLSPDGSTAMMSATMFVSPATRKMKSGVRASCRPRHAPCATVHMSTTGMAMARTRRYPSPASTSSGDDPMNARSCGAKVYTSREADTPLMMAKYMADVSASCAEVSLLSAACLAMVAVVAMGRKVKSWKTQLKMAVFGPSAASPRLLTWPMHAVSMMDMSGSASSVPNAGSASVAISLTSRRDMPNTMVSFGSSLLSSVTSADDDVGRASSAVDVVDDDGADDEEEGVDGAAAADVAGVVGAAEGASLFGAAYTRCAGDDFRPLWFRRPFHLLAAADPNVKAFPASVPVPVSVVVVVKAPRLDPKASATETGRA
mmetsp:Transcript_6760/g.17571  ORF Transcript_6760/g.17571 Transcript_6760/m.17571 type:complete len:383 (+) Transcript_6760:619-1767(+)